MKLKSIILVTMVLISTVELASAQEAEPAPEPAPPVTARPTGTMTAEHLIALIKSVDPEASNQGPVWQFNFQEHPIILIYDDKADRMRMFTPIGPESALDAALMRRMLQANFDSALDARYAVANKLIWGVFIHPLSLLNEEEFASALVQVLNVATTFGTSFSSGLFTFGGGDSIEENRKLLEELRKRMNPSV